jgi:hypothetical protein
LFPRAQPTNHICCLGMKIVPTPPPNSYSLKGFPFTLYCLTHYIYCTLYITLHTQFYVILWPPITYVALSPRRCSCSPLSPPLYCPSSSTSYSSRYVLSSPSLLAVLLRIYRIPLCIPSHPSPTSQALSLDWPTRTYLVLRSSEF